MCSWSSPLETSNYIWCVAVGSLQKLARWVVSGLLFVFFCVMSRFGLSSPAMVVVLLVTAGFLKEQLLLLLSWRLAFRLMLPMAANWVWFIMQQFATNRAKHAALRALKAEGLGFSQRHTYLEWCGQPGLRQLASHLLALSLVAAEVYGAYHAAKQLHDD